MIIDDEIHNSSLYEKKDNDGSKKLHSRYP